MDRAFYSGDIATFLATSRSAILDRLKSRSVDWGFDVRDTQAEAWGAEIDLLKAWLAGIPGSVYFEYTIPRMGLRADVVLLIGAQVLVVEFKVGETSFTRADENQVWDYALDLKNFHETSHDKDIIPILVCTKATGHFRLTPSFARDRVSVPLRVGVEPPTGLLRELATLPVVRPINAAQWEAGKYAPTPTIIEAAQYLYRNHSVSEITRSEAGATNLTVTSSTVQGLIRDSREKRQKSVCFVTGVPGAGKTLVGLNVATANQDKKDEFYSVYLSGNEPLVRVLSEALARDAFARGEESGVGKRLGELRSEVKAFVQNVHRFRDECISDPGPPVEHVAIFDEAQRAWNLKQTADFMRRRKGHANFEMSEPEFLISCLDRHTDWATVVCLVGNGQEINTGEAGIQAWVTAVREKFPEWKMYCAEGAADSIFGFASAADGGPDMIQVPGLHLATSIRSFRADHLSSVVEAILELDHESARGELSKLDRYPMALTRSLRRARRWIREQARGSERAGLLVSHTADRLKPHAIDVRAAVDPVRWFLGPPDDTRSSNFLEDAATEFQVQGLEVDWSCVVWDADFRIYHEEWEHWGFRGDKWIAIRDETRQSYLRNAYRVLLTRARQGMVIVVPPGSDDDPTRLPAFYDQTFAYLASLGIPTLSAD